jgi:hypothetical protein
MLKATEMTVLQEDCNSRFATPIYEAELVNWLVVFYLPYWYFCFPLNAMISEFAAANFHGSPVFGGTGTT